MVNGDFRALRTQHRISPVGITKRIPLYGGCNKSEEKQTMNRKFTAEERIVRDRESRKRYEAANPEQRRERRRRSARKQKETGKLKLRRWRSANLEKSRKQSCEANRRYYSKNRVEILARLRRKRARNKDLETQPLPPVTPPPLTGHPLRHESESRSTHRVVQKRNCPTG